MHFISALLKQQEPDFIPYMINRKWDETDYNNYWYKQGTTDYALVAHVDTMNFAPGTIVIEEKNGFITNKNGVLGADDRAGVWLISQMMSLDPHVFLFNYEEFGGVGVKHYLETCEFPKEIKFLIEFDRKGYDQFVYYSQHSPFELTGWAKRHGFTEHWGSYSDVSTITKKTRIPHLNMSAGFMGEHTVNEYLHWPTLMRLGIKYYKMLKQSPTNVQKLPKEVPFESKWSRNWNKSYWDNYCEFPYENTLFIS